MTVLKLTAVLALLGHALIAHATDGLVAVKSPHNAPDTAQVWLGYNDPAFLAQRHGVPACPAVESLRKALSGLAEAAIAR